MRKINVLTYNVPHRKTYDTLCLLRASGYRDVTVWATPLQYVKRYVPLIEHRPKSAPIVSLSYVEQFGYSLRSIGGYDEIEIDDGLFLVCGANVFSEHFVNRHIIINAHPGYIPIVRGLDAFKWAVLENLPIGVTTHIVGAEVDAGEIIERREIFTETNDTFHGMAQRVYETEIAMLVAAIERIDQPKEYIGGGDYALRRRMPHEMERLLLEKFETYKHNNRRTYFVHDTSVVDVNTHIGIRTKIWHNCHISKCVHIGVDCVLGQNVFVGQNVYIGDNCKLQNNVSVYSGVTLENGVFCGPSCVFTNDLTPRARHPKGQENYVATLVREGATIGANATIICGNTIGRYAMIGAGALVTRDVKDYALMLGVPAKFAGWICECGKCLTNSLICESCRKEYCVNGANLVCKINDA
jgi:UDP-2-acetamido-3-amino-2,3-dideoxy-glucuronate N-acetyltransferase